MLRPEPHWGSMSTSSRAVVLAFTIALALWLLYVLRFAVLLIYVSAVFAIVLSPAVDSVQRLRIRGWSPGRGAAILLIISIATLALALFFAFALPPIIRDIQQLAAALPETVEEWRVRLSALPYFPNISSEDLRGYVGSLIGGAAALITGTFTVIAATVSVLLLTAYMILDGERLFQWSMLLVPASTRANLEPALRRSAIGMRRWLAGQFILMLVLGSTSAITFAALRVRYFYVLAVFAAIANIIPMLGPIVTVILAGLVAAIDSFGKLVGVLVYFFVYQQVENAFLTPNIMQAQVRISATAVLIALLVGAELAGVIGALVAVPSAVLVLTLVEYYIVEPRGGRDPDGP